MTTLYNAARVIAKRLLEHRELESRCRCEFERYVPSHPAIVPIPADRMGRNKNKRYDRRALYNALDGLCGICGNCIAHIEQVTADHVMPLSRGGVWHRNIVPAHSRCNGIKANRMPYPCEQLMLTVVNLKISQDVAK